MQVPLQISFRNCEPSEEIRAEIEKEAQRLEKFYDRITFCNVAVTAPNLLHHRQGGLFKIDLHIALPEHKDVIVNKTHGDVHQHEHISVAIRDAFSAAQRQIEDAARRMRGDVKQDEEPDRGRVTKLIAGEDYGFIETSDGREIYFHRDSVLNDAFERLKVGAEVRFVEEAGEKGPQASTVSLAA
jgi:cold shock CspA family protein/ribosome-associated translation inhibitor RaiA